VGVSYFEPFMPGEAERCCAASQYFVAFVALRRTNVVQRVDVTITLKAGIQEVLGLNLGLDTGCHE
jgi:hypothetical protein